MKKLIKETIAIIIITIIALSIISGIIISINILAKKNKEQVWAETNTIKIGEEEILYVDLTKKSDDYQKITQPKEELHQLSTNNESNVEKTSEDNQYSPKTNEDNPYSTKTIMIKTSNIDKISKAGNIESIAKISEDLYTIHYSNSEDTKKGYESLIEDEAIEGVIKDYKVSALESDQEDINLEVQSAQNGKEAWGIYDTGLVRYKYMLNQRNANQDIKVAVLDTGVRTTHEVFKNVNNGDRLDLTDSYNYISKNKNISDDNGHGTMVAGIISEGTSNNVKIVPVKTLDDKGEGGLLDVLEAMRVLSNKVDVINLSLGIDENEIDTNSKKYFDEFIKSIYNSGVMIVCASGNKGEENVYYPASSNYTIAVGATTTDKEIALFSNYGNTLDFTAPGKGLVLPYYTGDNIYNSDVINANISNSGTSFASPFVVSAIAMIKSENINYTPIQIKNILVENAEDLGVQGKDKYYGYGFINFDIDKFSKPVISSIEVNQNENNPDMVDITTYAVCGNPITYRAFTNTNKEPDIEEWKQPKNGPGNMITFSITAPFDKDWYLWLKDEKGNIVHEKIYTAKASEIPDPSTNTNTNTNTATNTNTNSNTNTNTNTSTESGTETTDIMYGDLNKNKKIDIGDLLKLKRHIAQSNDKTVAQKHSDWKLSSEEITIGDVNNNGRIDIGDILKIQRYMAAQNSTEVKANHPDWAKLTW